MIRQIPRYFFPGLLAIAILAVSAVAQTGSVDPTFNAVPLSPVPSNFNLQYVVQPDGKVLVYDAQATYVNGELRSGMYRLNADGTTDTTFSYNGEGGLGINNVMIAPDGKIVLAGTASPNHGKMVRLNSNGSLDNSFSVFISASGPPEFTGNRMTVNSIQADGKVIATHTSWGNIQGTWYSYSMKRYNVDATIDSSFGSPNLEGGHLVSTSALIASLPDGRFYLGISTGNHLGGYLDITRRLANGSVDPTYTAFHTTFTSIRLGIGDLAVTSDGGLLASGYLAPTGIGFPGQQQLRRFTSDGSSALGFASPLVYTGGNVHQLSDGKILYSASGWNATRPLMRLNSDGSVDGSYALDPSISSVKGAWDEDGNGRPILFVGTTTGTTRLVRLLADGAIDPTFTTSFGVPGVSYRAISQPDGKVIMAGDFASLGALPRNKFGRVNADGTPDPTFDPGTGFGTGSAAPSKMILQSDGKIVAIGFSGPYNGSPVRGIMRINPDGSLDESFSVTLEPTASILAVGLQSDGKIVVGGNFSVINGVQRSGLARLTSTGEVDKSFNAGLTSPSNVEVFDILIHDDGRIMISGRFEFINGVARTNLARIDSTGNADQTFSAQTQPVSNVSSLIRQPDGKYVMRILDNRVVRRNADGSPDSTFNAPTILFQGSSGSVNDILPLDDGTFLVGGRFDMVGGFSINNLARLKWNGALDSTFTAFPNSTVYSLAKHSSGKPLVAGAFTMVGETQRIGIARLDIVPLVRTTPFDFDGDGRADITVFRPSIARWYEALSSGPTIEEAFGILTDIPTPADFDGDGKTDEAIFRPSAGQTWYKSSVNGAQVAIVYGQDGDIPRPSDFDGDGKADIVLFRPSNSTWYRYGSTAGLVPEKAFGIAGDLPLVGDFDGDGKFDLAIFRPSTGDWWYSASSAGGAFRATHWGQSGDIPVPADFDGDGKTDHAIFRPSDGGWYIYNSSNGSFTIMQFGTVGDRPVAADYDGDGKADIAVFRPSNGIWYLFRSTAGFAGYQFGISTDVALPGSLIP